MTQSIESWILQARSAGYPVEQIRNEMKLQGWTDDQIELLIHTMTGIENETPRGKTPKK
ncbi:MAG: hypothetical protein WC289_04490 [Patescibacteria group bacterium]